MPLKRRGTAIDRPVRMYVDLSIIYSSSNRPRRFVAVLQASDLK